MAYADNLRFVCRPQNLIERCIIEDGVWEPGETNIVKEHCKPGFVVFDIGANIGYFTLLMSREVGPGGHVHAFEPTEYAMNRLKRNLVLNSHLPANITLNQMGLLAAPEVRKEAIEARFSGTIPSHLDPELIRFTTVDQYVADTPTERIDFMKIDVDGYDAEVLQGAADTIQRFRPELLVELNQRALQGTGHDVYAYLDMLIDFGYDAAMVAESGDKTTLARLRETTDLRTGSRNILLTPRRSQ